MLGYSEEELYGKSIEEFTHPDDVPADMELREEVLAGSLDRYQREKRYIRKDGELIWVRPTVSVVRNDEGEPQFLIGIIEDITERKRVEEALREAEGRFRSAFDNAPIGMAVVRLDGRYLQVNRSLCEILGYSEEELLSTTYKDITYPEDVDISMAYVRQILEGETDKYHLEKRYLHANGHPVWVSLGVSLVRDSEDRPLYFISQVQDITERKRAEEALKWGVVAVVIVTAGPARLSRRPAAH